MREKTWNPKTSVPGRQNDIGVCCICP